MKKRSIILVFTLLCVCMSAQVNVSDFILGFHLGDNVKNIRTIKKDVQGNILIVDDRGNKTTIKKDILGNTLIEDSTGKKTEIKTDVAGNTHIQDNRGYNKIVKRDAAGNLYIEDNKTNGRDDDRDNPRHPHWGKDRDKHLKENITLDIDGSLRYENNKGMEASLSTNIHGDKIYKDNRDNEITYSNEVWREIFKDMATNDRAVLSMLANSYRRINNNKEKYFRNIHSELQYEAPDNYRASLTKDIFDNRTFSDSKNNQIKYSKHYWGDIMSYFEQSEVESLVWFVDNRGIFSNFKEEYDVNIFDDLKYSNNKGQRASITNDKFKNIIIYEDSAGNKTDYTPAMWSKVVKEYGSNRKVFIALVRRYLTDKKNK